MVVSRLDVQVFMGGKFKVSEAADLYNLFPR
jgi:hypothetical protein